MFTNTNIFQYHTLRNMLFMAMTEFQTVSFLLFSLFNKLKKRNRSSVNLAKPTCSAISNLYLHWLKRSVAYVGSAERNFSVIANLFRLAFPEY